MSINTVTALPVSPLPDVMLEPLVRMALLEDLGRAGDLTTDTIVPADARDELRLVARQDGVLAGLDLARLAFTLMDGGMEFDVGCQDGTGRRIPIGHAVKGHFFNQLLVSRE